jgi:hypothetical protein
MCVGLADAIPSQVRHQSFKTLRNAEFAKPFDRVTGAEVLELEHLAHFGFAFLNSTKVRRHQGN